MKKVISLIAAIVTLGIMAGILSPILNTSAGASTAIILTIVLLAAANSKPSTYHRADLGVDVNIWAKEMIKRYFKDNAFLKYAKSETEFVVGGAAVLIPQPGARPNVVKNRASFPATAVRRGDTTVMYVLDEYSTDPTHITKNELASISYDKINSVIDDHFGYLLQDASDDQLIKWALNLPAGLVLPTAGSSTEALEMGQTGMRKAMTWRELSKAQAVMNKANVPKNDRVALIEENMFQQFLDSLSDSPYKDFSRAMNEVEGKVPRLFGFDILTRSSVVMADGDYSGGLDVNALDAVIGGTDNVTSLCWQKDTVANAMGAVNLFGDTNNPFYYGDVASVSMRGGGRRRRGDNLGMIAITQGAVGGN